MNYTNRMYNWDFFKTLTKRDESNPGYKFKDWWIPSKYASLKQELLNTGCLSAEECAVVVDKAQVIVQSLRSRSIRNNQYWCTATFTFRVLCRISALDFTFCIFNFLRSTFRARSTGRSVAWTVLNQTTL